MSKLMIITVGTSLFHSASWNETEDGFKKLLGNHWNAYNEFWARGEGLKDPDFRRKNDAGIEKVLKQKLTKQNAQQSAQWLAPYDRRTTPVMRYSAELATILSFADEEKGYNWQTFLQGYEFFLVHDSNESIDSYRAACHLRQYLHKLTEVSLDKIHKEAIDGFSNDRERPLIEALNKFQEFINEKIRTRPEQIILVISGGFKLYSLVAMRFLINPRITLIYKHEASPDVVRLMDKDFVKMGRERKRLIEPMEEGG